jgi:hypothetical protein
MKNIHILPTDKPSRLWTNNLKRRLELDEFPEIHHNKIGKHIYITSDEEIKEGDWIIWDRKIVKAINTAYYSAKKIILTTDQDLIKDGVQAIDDEFLEWLVKNPSCELVEVQLVALNEYGSEISVNSYGFEKFSYKITIPKEETLEEAAERLYPTTFVSIFTQRDKVDKNKERRKIWIEGAKWQQEQILQFLYSEITERRPYSSSKMCEEVIKFIEQFKKK